MYLCSDVFSIVSISLADPMNNKFSFYTIFWGLAAIEGLFSIGWFVSLPASEAERSLVFGLSFTRLAVLAVFGAAVVFCTFEWVTNLRRKDMHFRRDGQIRRWFEKHDFAATAALSVMLVWAFMGVVLEIVLNPSWFPRSALYGFLYIRIRPIFLWTAAVCLQGFILAIANGWYRLKGSNPARGGGRFRLGAIISLVLLVAGNLVLWLVQTNLPDYFIDPEGFTLPAILILAALLIGLVAALNRAEA